MFAVWVQSYCELVIRRGRSTFRKVVLPCARSKLTNLQVNKTEAACFRMVQFLSYEDSAECGRLHACKDVYPTPISHISHTPYTHIAHPLHTDRADPTLHYLPLIEYLYASVLGGGTSLHPLPTSNRPLLPARLFLRRLPPLYLPASSPYLIILLAAFGLYTSRNAHVAAQFQSVDPDTQALPKRRDQHDWVGRCNYSETWPRGVSRGFPTQKGALPKRGEIKAIG